MVNIVKVAGCYYLTDRQGRVIVGYPARKDTEAAMRGEIAYMYNKAERHNERRDFVLAYLSERAKRPARVNPQLEMF